MESLAVEVEALGAAIRAATSPDLGASVAELRQHVKRITAQLDGMSPGFDGGVAAGRSRIAKMSAEVVDTNPYSRLMALQRMGIVADYERIRDKTVAVVGIGGVGSVAAEMLTRCGVGRLLLYDYDRVELANMNRLFFRPEQCGMTKTDATIQTLHGINPDVHLEGYNENITTVSGFSSFMASLRRGTDGPSRVDLVLSCVDNYEARMVINQACNELGQTWLESGVSEDAVSGHVQLLVPGETACFECAPPLVVASGVDERTLKREGVCAASLPTTMGIVAGLLVQNALKHLLQFGTVTRFLGYSALKDFFPTYEMKPNPSCNNAACRTAQAQHQAHLKSPAYLASQAAAAAAAAPLLADTAAAPLHAENEWGISVVDDSAASAASSQPEPVSLPAGLQFSMPGADKMDQSTLAQDGVQHTDESVDDLMRQLHALSSSGP